MKQYLFYQFRADIFKKPPLVRLYIDNVLNDEFNLVDWPTVSIPSRSADDFLDPKISRSKQCEEKIKVVEFYCDKPELDIAFKVYNNDNNFTNGFMTKCTLVALNFILIANQKVIRLIDRLNERKHTIYHEKVMGNIWAIKDAYKLREYCLINNFSNLCDIYEIDSGKKIMCPEVQSFYTFGTNVEYRVSLVKRHGFWMIKNHAKRLGVLKTGYIKDLKFLYNKYVSNENK